VHVGACPLADAQELARHAKASGAQCLSSVVPLDAPNNLDAAVQYFKGALFVHTCQTSSF
jgi:dihydrodipicolinate synthase/N-acetylneuraminate lyase